MCRNQPWRQAEPMDGRGATSSSRDFFLDRGVRARYDMFMVKREIYGTYNVCIERLLDPPMAPRGLMRWHGMPIEELLRRIPFSIERPADIDDDSDFMRFGNVFDYERSIDLLDDFRELLIECFQLSLDDTMSDAAELAEIVSAAKYPFTLRRVLRGVVGEDMAFGFELPYLVEAESDLLAACVLAGQAFWKQSTQLLRSALEVAVAHAYFGLRGDDYHFLLTSTRFRMPAFKGRGGMLENLVQTQTIDESLAAECMTLYSELSERVHSHIHHLSVTESQHSDAVEWCQLCSKVGNVVLRLILMLLRKGI
jgi:hypothetical protein